MSWVFSLLQTDVGSNTGPSSCFFLSDTSDQSAGWFFFSAWKEKKKLKIYKLTWFRAEWTNSGGETPKYVHELMPWIHERSLNMTLAALETLLWRLNVNHVILNVIGPFPHCIKKKWRCVFPAHSTSTKAKADSYIALFYLSTHSALYNMPHSPIQALFLPDIHTDSHLLLVR